jgi:hypothetical protein
MDFWKFEDLLKRSALYFSRPDQFKDPFEGRFSLGNSSKMSVSDAALNAAYKIEHFAKGLEAAQDIMRQVVFVSCWQRGTKESREMWQAYTSGPESVVITTSAGALYKLVPDSIIKSPVKYHGDDFPRTAFDHTSLFFYKPYCYSFEREFRLLLTTEGEGGVHISELGRYVPINCKKIVHRVITHPKASMDFKAKVDGLMRMYLTPIRRENSALLP